MLAEQLNIPIWRGFRAVVSLETVGISVGFLEVQELSENTGEGNWLQHNWLDNAAVLLVRTSEVGWKYPNQSDVLW